MKKLILIFFMVSILLLGCSPVVEEQEIPGESIGEPINEICGNDLCELSEKKFNSCGADCGGVAGITKKQCDEVGGKWNDCGSACAGLDAEICIEVCSEQCECDKENFSCPEGFTCRLSGKRPKEIGVCIGEN
jgi:hypothetical protein